MQDPSWDDLRFFLAAARGKSLGAAGKRLGADASTVGRRVAALEAALCARLFLRTREGLHLTPEGERLREGALRIEAEIEQLTASGLVRPDAVAGTVRVATTEALGAFLVQRGLAALAREHPGLSVEVLGGNHPVDLARGEADIALRPLRPTEAGLKIRPLASLGFGVYASPEYVRRRGAARDAESLSGHDIVVPSAELGQLPEAKWLRAINGARVTFQSNSLPCLVAAIREGAGAGVLPIPWGAMDEALTLLFALGEIPARKLWLVTAATAMERAAVAVVARKIEAALRG